MDTTGIMPVPCGGKTMSERIKPRIGYFRKRFKDKKLATAYKCTPGLADAEFVLSEAKNRALTGREQRDDVLAYQVCQTFVEGELTPEKANSIGYELAMRFTKGEHAFVVYTHVKKKHIHNNIFWNSTTLDCTGKFQDFDGSADAVRELSKLICGEHGVSAAENP